MLRNQAQVTYRHRLISSLTRSSENEQNPQKGVANKLKGLTLEIFGNIFVTMFAGRDTTANTLAYAMLLLAAYPEVQDWVG